MIEVKRLTEFSPELGEEIRHLLIDLSRSKKDPGEITKERVQDIIDSDWHDLLMAVEDDKLLGIASVSIVMGAGVGKNAYLEDFVVSAESQGKGIGKLLWAEIVKWGKEKGAKRLEFTSGRGREAAQAFYQKRGAEIYDTNFFRFEL